MKFAVVSDIHAEQHQDWSRLVFERMGARTDLAFVAFLGDICTSPGDSWDKWFKPLRDMIRVPFLACRGNHDDEARFIEWFTFTDMVRVVSDSRLVFFDSQKINDNVAWLEHALEGPENHKYVFTHYPLRIGHWCYGFSASETEVITPLLKKHNVFAYFCGHRHGFDFIRCGETFCFVCGGGGGGYTGHDDFSVLHVSNFYLLVEDGHVTVCQQHSDREELHPMEKWINETRRPAF